MQTLKNNGDIMGVRNILVCFPKIPKSRISSSTEIPHDFADAGNILLFDVSRNHKNIADAGDILLIKKIPI